MRYAGTYPLFFWHMDADDSVPVMLQAKQRETEEKIFQRWINGYQWEMGFEEFKRTLRPFTSGDAKEILKNVEQDYDRAFKQGFEKVELTY